MQKKTLSLLLLLSLLFLNSSTYADYIKKDMFYYKVKRGNNIFSLSKTFNIPLSKLLTYNKNLTAKSQLLLNSTIKIPAYLVTPYKIKRGENLSQISKRYHISLDSLKSVLDPKVAKNMWVGTQIYLPVKSSSPPVEKKPSVKTSPAPKALSKPNSEKPPESFAPQMKNPQKQETSNFSQTKSQISYQASSSDSSKERKNPAYLNYHVHTGDTFFSIYRKFHIPVKTLQEIHHNKPLQNGETFKIPISLILEQNGASGSSAPNTAQPPKEKKLPPKKKTFKVVKASPPSKPKAEVIEKPPTPEKKEEEEKIPDKDLPKDTSISPPLDQKYKIPFSSLVPGSAYKNKTSTMSVKSPIVAKVVKIASLPEFGQTIFLKNSTYSILLSSKGFSHLKVKVGDSVSLGDTIASLSPSYTLYYFIIKDKEVVSH